MRAKPFALLLDLMDSKNSRAIEKETVDMAQKANTHTAPPRYDDTLKQGTVRMVTEQKRPIKEAASDMGICTDTLKKWLKDAGIQPIAADHGNRDAKNISGLEPENHSLRKSLSEKEEAFEIPKKSVGILSRP